MPTSAEAVIPFAAVALDNLTREYPYNDQHLVRSPEDHLPVATLHPAFANSFDWHSSVHMHFLLVSLLDTEVTGEWRERAISVISQHFSDDNLQREAAYLRANPSWERPYGWAWAAQLSLAVQASSVPEVAVFASAAQQLADTVYALVLAWLPKLPEPVRHGVHSNLAFALRRIRRAAIQQDRNDVVSTIDEAARRFYLTDSSWAFDQERSGHDFLSAGLCEADLMLDLLSQDELTQWLPAFLSQLGPSSRMLAPVEVLDPSDGHQSHLYGLGLAAAASLMRIIPRLQAIGLTAGNDDLIKQAELLRQSIPVLMAPGLEAGLSDEYMSSHWIATFAWEALLLRESLQAAD